MQNPLGCEVNFKGSQEHLENLLSFFENAISEMDALRDKLH